MGSVLSTRKLLVPFKATLNLCHGVKNAVLKTFGSPKSLPREHQFLEDYRKHDAEDNTNTTPPVDECIDLRCMWGVEFYTPSYFDSLVNSFRKLGWDKSDDFRPSQNPINWLYSQRRYHYGGSSLNLGILMPHSTNQFIAGQRREAPIPTGVNFASAGIYSISSSLICIVVNFELKEELSTSFDKALRKDRQTFEEPTSRGYRIHRPRNQKVDHITRIRAEMSKLVSTWFSQNLPGLFSSGLLEGALPTFEFTTLRKAEPFATQRQNENTIPEYIRTLRLDSDFSAWQSTKIPGLKFQPPTHSESKLRYHSVLAIREDDLDSAMTDAPQGKDRTYQIFHLDLMFSGLISVWAILPLLEGYTYRINKVRDSSIFRTGIRQNPVKVLEELGSNISYSVDIAAAATELITCVRQRFTLTQRVEAFKPCRGDFYERGYTLSKFLNDTIGEQSAWVKSTDESLRDHLTQCGSLLGAAEDVRLQRKVNHLTWIIICLSVVSVSLAIAAIVT